MKQIIDGPSFSEHDILQGIKGIRKEKGAVAYRKASSRGAYGHDPF